MMRFEELNPAKLSNSDIALLEQGCAGSHDKATAKHQVDAALNGSAYIFRSTGDFDGIFVLSIGNRYMKELVMTALAGKGMIKHFPEFYSEVKKLCIKAGTKRLSGFVSRPGLKRLYLHHTAATPRATLFVDDLTKDDLR
jgi:hypothetical protein